MTRRSSNDFVVNNTKNSGNNNTNQQQQTTITYNNNNKQQQQQTTKQTMATWPAAQEACNSNLLDCTSLTLSTIATSVLTHYSTNKNNINTSIRKIYNTTTSDNLQHYNKNNYNINTTTSKNRQWHYFNNNITDDKTKTTTIGTKEETTSHVFWLRNRFGYSLATSCCWWRLNVVAVVTVVTML